MENAITINDPRVKLLYGGNRRWFDVDEQKFVSSTTLYLAYGCPDWGETRGKRNKQCIFCALPNAVIGYRDAFYGGQAVPSADHIAPFKLNLEAAISADKNLHTLMIFNAGSFLAMESVTQQKIMKIVSKCSSIKSVVIEARAKLIDEKTLAPLVEILNRSAKKLTIRIGVETKNDHLRLRVLRKGHSRNQLHYAVALMKKYGVRSGGYALLNPAPEHHMRDAMGKRDATKEEINLWAINETRETLNWILSTEDDGLEMDEAYFCATCVGPDTPLTKEWEKGSFAPATLWMVYDVLRSSVQQYNGRIHALPFRDTPQFIAVSSNHVEQGISESLEEAQGCDLPFHAMLDHYRKSMNPDVLIAPQCSCKPSWLKE